MKETGFWATAGPNLKQFGIFDRVENLIANGTPDINFLVKGVEGWIELKHEREWPKRIDTIVRFDIKDGQRHWWIIRRAAGGRVFVFVQVHKCYFLFDAQLAARHLSVDWAKADLETNAIGWWSAPCQWREVVKALIQPQNPFPTG